MNLSGYASNNYVVMKEKKKKGLYIGRFQPVSWGHIRVIDTALEECENLIIVIGSIQEVGTEKNPFNFSDRKKMFKRIFFDAPEKWEKIQIIGLPDIFNPNGWAKYVLNTIRFKIAEEEIIFPIPDNYYCGSYYDGYLFENSGLDIRIVDRTDIKFPPVSSSMIRQMCVYQDKRWKDYVPEQIWGIVQELEDRYTWKKD